MFRRNVQRISPGVWLLGWVLGVAFQLQQIKLWPIGGYQAAAALAGLGALLWSVSAVRKRYRATPQSAPQIGPRWSYLARLALALLLTAMAAYGVTGWRASEFAATALQPALEGQDIRVTGVVLSMPQVGDDALRFRFGVDSAQHLGQPVHLPPQLLLSWYGGGGVWRTPESASAPIRPAASSALQAGDRWRLTVRLKAPHGARNPHGFDYELWMWEQGVQASGYVRETAPPSSVQTDPKAAYAAPLRLSSSWSHPVERARQAVRARIDARILDRQRAGLLAALVVGDQSAIDRADWDVFRATGVAHLVSISGLHITMFAWLASLLVGRIWRASVRHSPRLCLAVSATSAAAWGGLALATLYALFSGWGVPAQRTICMLATVVLLRQSGRQWPWPQVWLLAMAVVLLLDPWALLQAGFWLSFVAVGVLFASGPSSRPTPAVDETAQDDSAMHEENAPCTPPGEVAPTGWRALGAVQAALPGAPWFARLQALLKEQWVVTLALTPLTLLLFNQVSLVGLLANTLAIPWVTLLLTPLAMLGVVWSPAWDAAAWVGGVLTWFLGYLASGAWASVHVAAAPTAYALAGLLGGACLVLPLPWRWRVLGVPLMLPVLLWLPPRPATGVFELLAVDIGQGNAVLVRTAQHALLYDAGPRFNQSSDAGERVLVPLLHALGERLDMLVLSHRDSDHSGGAPAVLAMQPTTTLLSSIEAEHPLQLLRPARRCVAGQHWNWDGVRFEVLHPELADYRPGVSSNALSCVLKISSPQASALLVGDIGVAQETRLLQTGAALQADVLLVPHHGSKSSSSPEFIAAVQPRWALVQAGYRNRFGHPASAVAARYTGLGVPLVSSPQCGAMQWSSQQPNALHCQRAISLRYWHHRVPGSALAPSTRRAERP